MIPDALAALTVPIDSVHPAERNPRRGNVDKIAASLQRLGQYRPIVVNERTHEVLAGNHTYRAAVQLGWDEIAVTYVDVDDDTAVRIALIDNRSNDLAAYDDNELLELLKEVNATDSGLDGTGFLFADLETLMKRLEADFTGNEFDERYEVVVECADEAHQTAVLERLAADGLKVRAIVV